MLAERLNEVAYDVHRHGQHESIVSKLQAVVTTVRQIEQPAGDQAVGQLRSNLEKKLEQLYSSLGKERVNEFASSEKAILKEVEGWELTGKRLRRKVEDILAQPALDDVGAGDRLADLVERVDGLYDALGALVESFDELGVQRSTLPVGETAELGAIYPIEMGEATLSDVHGELEELEDHLRWLAQVAGDTPGQTRVRAIGSSGLEVFLESPLGLAAAFGIAIEACERIIERGLNIAKQYKELRDSGTPEEISDERIERIAQRVVDQGIQELIENLMDRYTGDPGRGNEIRQGLELDLRYLIEKINDGGEFEVRVIPPTDESEDEEVRPGFGTMRDMKRRGRVMATVDLSELPAGDLRLLGEPPVEEEEDEPPREEGQDGEEDGADADAEGGAEEGAGEPVEEGEDGEENQDDG